ncbi:hypothetical protein [Clostridium sp.]|uniref:DUF6414 family protein n=1 Tax=Clostridium sp. TaxID=1506 RepID=UPI002FCB8B77
MNEFFVPLYVNDEIILSMFKIAIERFIEVEKITNKQEVIINSNVPLCELTCGKILQGNASVQLLQGYTRRTIQEIEKSTITTYIRLVDILNNNKFLKQVKNKNDLEFLQDGDIVELKCKMKMNSKLKKIQHVIDILEIESALDDFNLENTRDSKSNNKAILNWFKSTLQSVKESKCTKYITEPLFNTEMRGIIPIQNNHSLMELDCNYHTNFTIIGKVSSIEKGENKLTPPINTESCFDFINDKLSSLIGNELLDKLNLDELNEEDFTKYVEIIPVMIYV